MATDAIQPVTFGVLEDVLGFRLQRLRAALSAPILAAMKEWGLRRGAFMVLTLVQENPGVSQSTLVRETGIRKSLLVALLHELEEREFLVRKTLVSDRRHNQLFITSGGREIVSRMAEIILEVEAPIRDALSVEALVQLNATLDLTLAALRRASKGSG